MRILTYMDPRDIDKTNYWDEIKKYPHLCISQTLVQGLSQRYGRTEFTYLCTIESFLNEFYNEWKNDGTSLEQYIELSNELELIKDKKLKNSMKFNKNDVYKSIKILFESNIQQKDINQLKLNDEQREILSIYDKLGSSSNWNKFKYLKDKDIEGVYLALRNILVSDIKKELTEELIEKGEDSLEIIKEKMDLKIEELSKKINNIKKAKENLSDFYRKNKRDDEIIYNRLIHYKNLLIQSENNNFNCDKIIFHGIHQFTPLIYKLIKHLELGLNIEVVFLINYNSQYSNIYKTWENVYKWTDKEFEKCSKKNERFYFPVGENIGNLLEGNINKLDDMNKRIIKFDNLTSFANYVACKYEVAKNKLKDSNIKKIKTSQILANMDEQFYCVSGKEVNDLLRVYFPEQFGEKHFLSYPIGQFILGLYNMWDDNENRIKVNENSMRECLSINLWENGIGCTPLEIYEKVKLYFSDLEDMDEYLKRIDILICNLKKVKEKEAYKPFEKFSFFSITMDEARYFKQIVVDLDNITKILFNNNKGSINIKQHYNNLLEIFKDRVNNFSAITKEEIGFVEEICSKLENTSTVDSETTISTVKETLHFYLNIKKEEDSANWIVRDFEQIDGGVLLADPDGKEVWNKKSAFYHYGELSDNNFSKGVNDILPWPLSESMFNKKNKAINIVLDSKREYSNFLRYTLFYGSYFLNNTGYNNFLKLSFIESIDEDKNNMYFLLKMLGMKIKSNNEQNSYRSFNECKRISTGDIKLSQLNKDDEEAYTFCPIRFLYERILDKKQYYTNEFQCNYFIKTELSLKFRKQFQKENIENAIKKIDAYLKIVRKIFPFWHDSNFIDIKNSIIKNLNNWNKDGIIFNRDERYERIREKFLVAKIQSKSSNKTESFIVNNKDINNEIMDFIKMSNEMKIEVIEEKCRFCSYREICARVFLLEE